MLASIYTFGDEIPASTRNGDEFEIGSVIEGEWKRMAFIFAVRCDDGSFIAFDVRKVPGLSEGFGERVSAVHDRRLAHLVALIAAHFESRETFLVAVSLVGNRMASDGSEGR